MKLILILSFAAFALADDRCEGFDPTGPPLLFPHETDCNLFYSCASKGAPILQNCAGILEFDPVQQMCDFPNGSCQHGSTTEPSETEPTSGPTETDPTSGPTESTEAPEMSQYCDPDENPEFPTHLPHPTDCTKFFKCELGVAVEITCPEGQHWFWEMEWCDFIVNAKCVRPIPPTEAPTEGPPTTPAPPTEAPELSEHCDPEENPEFPTHLPHPTDCTKFFKCELGYAIEHSCPEGQHWFWEMEWCDFIENANCVRPLE